MKDILFRLQPASESGLQAQLREKLVAAILDGQIPKNERLPSTRHLSKVLGISRNTVTLAYQSLIDDGFLVSRERSGTFVNSELTVNQLQTYSKPKPSGPAHPHTEWTSRLRVRPSAQENIAKPADWPDYPYPFIYGQVDDKLFPIAEWRDCSRRALGRQWLDSWTADHHTNDDEMLIEQIRTRLLPRRGIMANKDEILVTLGAQNALYLLASLLVKRDTITGLENPGYPDVRNIFELRTDRIVALPVDDEGLLIDAETGRCGIIYVTPSHHAPTTVTMPEVRRLQLLEAASANDSLIIEDDYEFETNFVSAPSPALKSLDREGRVLYVGSLSKTLFPGLRLGYLVADAELIREARALRRLMIRHPPNVNQRTAAQFIALGHHDAMLLRLRRAYGRRWENIRNAVTELLPGYRIMPSNGGSSIWIEGPEGFDAIELARRALKRGVIIEPGHIYFAETPAPRNHFRLGFSSIESNKISDGIKIIAECIADG
ncbi:MAG: PLP-dependent aminotransferase family protein [Hyphomicrobiaceae bacterium]